MEAINNIRQLFTIAPKKEDSPLISQNPELRHTGETYHHWGLRICGIVEGSLQALVPYLQNIYNYIYKEQVNNEELQKQIQKNTQTEIAQKNVHLESLNTKIEKLRGNIEETKGKIKELEHEKQEIKSCKEEVNKDQRLQLIIGLCIIIPLTFYLFLFYSSTFYSAFFRDFQNMSDSVLSHMFDSHALSSALNSSVTALLFVLSAPVIFLGLGYGLHSFSHQKGNDKYLKIGAILLVTFAFDSILAFLIGRNLHTIAIMTGAAPLGEQYSMSLALEDINTWAVIFCGFIVYVIWGIVFDMCMNAYHSMDLNKTKMESISQEIGSLKQEIKGNKTQIDTLENECVQTRKDIESLTSQMGKQVYIDYAVIRKEMTDFFSGWITQMQVLTCPVALQNEARNMFNTTIDTLIPSKNS